MQRRRGISAVRKNKEKKKNHYTTAENKKTRGYASGKSDIVERLKYKTTY